MRTLNWEGLWRAPAASWESLQLEEGRALYKSRVSAEISTQANFFERAINDIVLRSKAHVKSKIW